MNDETRSCVARMTGNLKHVFNRVRGAYAAIGLRSHIVRDIRSDESVERVGIRPSGRRVHLTATDSGIRKGCERSTPDGNPIQRIRSPRRIALSVVAGSGSLNRGCDRSSARCSTAVPQRMQHFRKHQCIIRLIRRIRWPTCFCKTANE
jgi:hypothetical protein